jgi:hypothetical protein
MKPSESLSFWDYVREAFHWKSALPLLGSLPLNKMGLGAFVVAGLANPGFWLLGAAFEISLLFGLASSQRFQKLVEAQRLLDSQSTWKEKVERAVVRLSVANRERYRALLAECRRILGDAESLDSDSLGQFRDLRTRSLSQLLTIFLRLLGSKELIEANLPTVDAAELKREASEVEKRLSTMNEETPLKRSLQGTLEIHRRRLENMERALESLRVIDAELERIEKQVELIREETAVSGKPEILTTRLDAVTSTMSETNRWMDDHSEFFSSLSGDETIGSVSELPELPPEIEKE